MEYNDLMRISSKIDYLGKHSKSDILDKILIKIAQETSDFNAKMIGQLGMNEAVQNIEQQYDPTKPQYNTMSQGIVGATTPLQTLTMQDRAEIKKYRKYLNGPYHDQAAEKLKEITGRVITRITPYLQAYYKDMTKVQQSIYALYNNLYNQMIQPQNITPI